MVIDPRTQLFVPDSGQRWMSVADVEREMRRMGISRFTLPGTLSREQVAAWQALRDGQYYLVRNRGGSTGERYRCTRKDRHNCGALHEFFTLAGRPRPFRGLDRALWGYAWIKKDTTMQHKLLDWAPHLDEAHPRLARDVGPREPGADLIAVALGVLVKIEREEAEAFARDINARVRDPWRKVVL